MAIAIIGAIDKCNSFRPVRHYGAEPQPSPEGRAYRTRRIASCIRLPSRRAPRLCANSCIGYRSDNGSRTSWRPLLSRRSTVGPHCIFMNSFETIRSPEHFDLLLLHCFTDHLCLPSSPLGRSTTLHLKFGTVSGHHKIGEHFQ